MSDLIERQAAIDAIEETDWYHIEGGKLVHGANSKEHEPLYKAKDIYSVIGNLPSAQPETAKRIVVKSRYSMTLWYQCNMCNEPVDVQDNYCRGCGRRLTDG